MKTRNVAFRLSVLAIIILTGMIFCSVSFADYGSVVQGSLCGSGGSGGGSDGGGFPPVSGDKVDLTPDFDIYNDQGQEISTNHSDDSIQTVQVGQQIKLNLTTEVHNDDTDNHLRDNDSESIEGPIYYWIEGIVPKTLIVSEEFDVDDLDKHNDPDEEEWFTIPNHPGTTISFQAEVDGDDEVDEESEGNNTSRVERLYIAGEENNQPEELSDTLKAAVMIIISD